MSPAITYRERLEALIETAIAALDEIDGDCDLECNADAEPSLCGPGQYQNGRMEADLEADGADDEPNLGWSEYQSENGKPTLGEEFHPESRSTRFNGRGCLEANTMLRQHRLPTVRLMVGIGI